MDYDKTDIPAAYNRGRDHGPVFLEQWMRVVSRHVDPAGVHDIEVISQQIVADYSDYADKIAVKADSILASLDDKVFDAGLRRLRAAAATAAVAQPITEPIDFLVFEPN